MITRMSKKISSYFVIHKIIPADDQEVYEYSFEVLLSTIISFIALFLLAAISNTMLLTSLYLLGFIPLRLIAGGFHAKSNLRCFVILIFAYSTYLAIIRLVPPGYLVIGTGISMVLSCTLVFMLAPSEDANKPITREEHRKFKKKSRITIICYFVLVFIIITIVTDKRPALSIAAGNATVAISLLANFIKARINK